MALRTSVVGSYPQPDWLIDRAALGSRLPPRTALDGVDIEDPGTAIDRTGSGPFTLAQQAQNDHYGDEAELALAYAAAVNEEGPDLEAAGADIVQIDEPYLQARPDQAREYALPAIARAVDCGMKYLPRTAALGSRS
jgi:methionine synthase II (cobalamin-independent)